jgi:membrane protein YqaA with SNARE-associated domain
MLNRILATLFTVLVIFTGFCAIGAALDGDALGFIALATLSVLFGLVVDYCLSIYLDTSRAQEENPSRSAIEIAAEKEFLRKYYPSLLE